MTALVLDFDHLRRARRLLPILVDRFGVAHFFGARVLGGGRRSIDEDAIDDAVELAVAWIERRSGRDVDDEVVHRMRRDLERLVFARVKEGRGSLR